MTVQPIEVAWTIIVGIGLAFSGWNAWQSIQDFRALESRSGIDGIGRVVIGGSALGEGIRLFKLVLLFAVGILAMFQPQSNGSSVDDSYIIAVQVLLLLFAVGLSANTIIAVIVRIRVKRLSEGFTVTPVKEGSPIKEVPGND